MASFLREEALARCKESSLAEEKRRGRKDGTFTLSMCCVCRDQEFHMYNPA